MINVSSNILTILFTSSVVLKINVCAKEQNSQQYNSKLYLCILFFSSSSSFFFFFLVVVFWGMYLRHMEVPRLGVELEL